MGISLYVSTTITGYTSVYDFGVEPQEADGF